MIKNHERISWNSTLDFKQKKWDNSIMNVEKDIKYNRDRTRL